MITNYKLRLHKYSSLFSETKIRGIKKALQFHFLIIFKIKITFINQINSILYFFVIHIIENKSNLSSEKNQKEHEEYMGMKSVSM